MLKASVCIYKYFGIHKKIHLTSGILHFSVLFLVFAVGGWTRYKIKHTFLKLFVTVTVAKWCTEFPV